MYMKRTYFFNNFKLKNFYVKAGVIILRGSLFFFTTAHNFFFGLTLAYHIWHMGVSP